MPDVDHLIRLIRDGRQAEALQLLNAQPEIARDRSSNDGQLHGASPLHWAGHRNMVGLCRRLVELGADVNNSASDWWLTPLSWAADAGSADAVGFLLERGADPNQDAIVGTTALHAAAVGGSSRGRNNPEAYRRTAELLVAHGVDHLRRSTGERGRTALEEAIAAGNVAVERVLRERGCTFPDEETHRDL